MAQVVNVRDHHSPGDGRNDQNCVAVFDRRIRAVLMSDVFFVDIDINKVAQRILIVEQMTT